MAQLEFRRLHVVEVGIQKPQRIQVRDVMSANLVRSDQQLGLDQAASCKIYFGLKNTVPHLEMVVKFTPTADVQRWSTIRWNREVTGRRLEGLRASQALVEAGKIDIPGDMHRLGVLPPMSVHFLCVVCICSVCKRIVG
jgi:hypothetical protein